MSFASYPDSDNDGIPGDPRDLSQLPPTPTLGDRLAGGALNVLRFAAGSVLLIGDAIGRRRRR